MIHKINDLNFLLLFSRVQKQSSVQRFVNSPLFDYHVLPLIYEYLCIPLLAPLAIGTYGDGDMHFPLSLCVHSITGDLWVADYTNKHLCIYQIKSKELSCVQSIKCKGNPTCVRVSSSGRVVVTERGPGAVSMFDAFGATCGRFGEGQLKEPHGVAIIEMLQLMAVTDWKRNCIDMYTLDGEFIRTLTTAVKLPWGVCWNESEALLYVSSNSDHLVHVIDMKSDTRKCSWGSGKGTSHNQFHYPCGMVFRPDIKKVLVADEFNNRIVVIDSKTGHFIKSYGTGTGGSAMGQFSQPYDIALHHRDIHEQLFVCERGNHRIQIIKM